MSTISASPGVKPRAVASRHTNLGTLVYGVVAPQRVSLVKPVNVGLMAELAAARHGRVPLYLDQPFAWDPGQRTELDYVELATLVEQMSAALVAAGVKRWDRVAIVKSPNYDVQSLAWAAARIGAVPALLSGRLDPDIINVLLDRLQAKFIITDPQIASYAHLDAARLRALDVTAIADIDGGIPVADLWGGPIPAPNPLKNDEPMMITHTSSTTGVSKLAETSARAVSFSAFLESAFPMLHNNRNELYASAISHVHVRGAVTQQASLSRGTPLIGIGRPDDDTIRRLFTHYRPTIVEAHPNAYVGWEPMTEDPAEPFSSIRWFLNTFDAIHPRTIRRFLDASRRSYPLWLQCYGMTETQVVSVRPYTKRSSRRLIEHDSRSVGWEVPGVRARIANPETGQRRRSQSEGGMIQVKTPARALAFVGTPEKFSERRHGKWFDTGDWGRRGRWGQLEVLDRVADRIDGVQSCLWMEDVLLDRIPDAEEILVVPDGQGKPVPVICLRDGKPLDPDAWRAAAAVTGLGEPFVVSPEDLQRTATVKARRYLLTEMIKNGEHERSQPLRPEIVLRDGA